MHVGSGWNTQRASAGFAGLMGMVVSSYRYSASQLSAYSSEFSNCSDLYEGGDNGHGDHDIDFLLTEETATLSEPGGLYPLAGGEPRLIRAAARGHPRLYGSQTDDRSMCVTTTQLRRLLPAQACDRQAETDHDPVSERCCRSDDQGECARDSGRQNLGLFVLQGVVGFVPGGRSVVVARKQIPTQDSRSLSLNALVSWVRKAARMP